MKNFQIKINVTEEDFRLGKKNNCKKCPVALALARALKERKIKYIEFSVSGCIHIDIDIDGDSKAFWAADDKIAQFINYFDDLPPYKSKFFKSTYEFKPFSRVLKFKKQEN